MGVPKVGNTGHVTVGNAIVILSQSVRSTLFREQEIMQANTYAYLYCSLVPMRYLKVDSNEN